MRLVDALIGLGDVLRISEQVEEAKKHYQKAILVSEQNGLPFGRIRAMVPLLHMERRVRAARQILADADALLDDATQLGDLIYLANIETIRAEALTLLRRDDDALAAAEAAEQYFDGNPVGLAALYIRLGDHFRMREDQELLGHTLQRLFVVLKTVPLSREQSDAFDLQAAWYLLRSELDEARRAAQIALEIAEQAGYQMGVNHARASLAQVQRKTGQLAEALAQRTESIRFFRESPDSKVQLAYALIERAELLIDLGQAESAVGDVVEGMNALETLRCEQTRPQSQAEYRERFAQIYRRSLQAACRMGDAPLFATAFEGLWGRRLAGLVDGPKRFEDIMLEVQLLAQSQLAGKATPETGIGRARRLLGRLASRNFLTEEVVEHTAAGVAALSRPYDFQSAREHLADIPLGTAAMLIAPMPERPGQVACLIVDHEGRSSCSAFGLPEETIASIRALNGFGYACTHQDLEHLSFLIPPDIARVPENVPMLVIPLEELWAIPWAAIPVPGTAGRYLGQRYPLRLCPSLAVAAAVRHRELPGQRRVLAWLSPDVDPGFWDPDEPTRCASAEKMRALICQGAPDQDALVVAHAIPTLVLTHILSLAPGVGLIPPDAMSSNPPGRVALLTCWSAHVPGESPGDPLTVATVLLARGAVTVLATSAELANEPLSGFFSFNVVHNEQEPDWSRALQQAISKWAGTRLFQQRLSSWVPLRVLGAW